MADDVAVGLGGAAVEHRRRVSPLGGGEGTGFAALGEAGGPVVVAEYSESIGDAKKGGARGAIIPRVSVL